MRRIIKWLFEKPMDLVFLQRMRDIEKQVHRAIENVSFEVLRAADRRIEFELQYQHTEDEELMIVEMLLKIEAAELKIRYILITECK